MVLESNLAEVVKGDGAILVGVTDIPDFKTGNLGTAGSKSITQTVGGDGPFVGGVELK